MADALVDTDVLIAVLRKHRPSMAFLARLYSEMVLATSAITAFELFGGSLTEDRREKVAELLATMEVVPLDVAAATQAGFLDRGPRDARLRLEPGDTLIAGIALSRSLPIVTGNLSHFERVSGLNIIPFRP